MDTWFKIWQILQPEIEKILRERERERERGCGLAKCESGRVMNCLRWPCFAFEKAGSEISYLIFFWKKTKR